MLCYFISLCIVFHPSPIIYIAAIAYIFSDTFFHMLHPDLQHAVFERSHDLQWAVEHMIVTSTLF